MSLSLWNLPLASADGHLLTNEECYMLLDVDFSDDLLKTFPNAPKLETSAAQEYRNHNQDEGNTTLYPPSPPETKPSRAELASDLMQQLDHQCKQENILSSWLEEKVDLPVYDGITQVHENHVTTIPSQTGLVGVPPLYTAPQPTEVLLREFESVYGAVELTHLTPPQSPPSQPGPATQLLLSYAQQAQTAPHAMAADWPVAMATDLEQLQSVEELLSSPQPSNDVSPRSSPPSSPRSSADEDWSLCSSRPKPYSRGGDDRRSRKKEQNKNAATRYRQKKKAEIEVLLNEEHSLRQRHSELGTKRADLQREIRYLKGLMRELFKAKGLIK